MEGSAEGARSWAQRFRARMHDWARSHGLYVATVVAVVTNTVSEPGAADTHGRRLAGALLGRLSAALQASLRRV
jgi:hypothetical protein